MDPFAAIVQAGRMPLIISDANQSGHPIVFVNTAFCAETGYARGEILGCNCRFLQGPETDRDTAMAIRDALRTATAIEIDIRNYRRNGVAFWNRLMIVPVRYAGGDLAYFFGALIDASADYNPAASAAERERLQSDMARREELLDTLHAIQDREAAGAANLIITG